MFRPHSHRDPKGYYACLGVDPSASIEAIAAAFRRNARVLHPDIAGPGNVGSFLALKAAYDVLGSAERRAAYDEAARRSTETANTRGASPPSKATRIYARQPMLAGQPISMWVGILAILIAAFAEVVIHLQRRPESGSVVEIRPNAPTVSPVRVTASRSLLTDPARPGSSGDANYFVIPSNGPATLWHQDSQQKFLAPVAQLAPFTTVVVLRFISQGSLAEVRLPNHQDGYVEAVQLAPGDVASAHRAYCGYTAGSPPTDGEVLRRSGTGDGRLTLSNRTDQSMVVKLRDQTGTAAVAIFLAPGGHVELGDLPNDLIDVDYAIGELWSRQCGVFVAGMWARRLDGVVSTARSAEIALPPDGQSRPPPTDISDDDFRRD